MSINAGIIGLGAMGHQFARHMKSKGFKVSGYDVSKEMCAKAKGIGVEVCASPAEVGARSDVVVIMVATDEQVEDVIGKDGLLQAMKPGSVICIASSVHPDTCRRIEKDAAGRKVGILDAPVVLGQEAADNGTCTTFVGGDESLLEKAHPVLAAYSANVLHVGPSGSGQITKMINNLLLWSCIAANYESLTLARKMGVDIPKLIEALKFSSGANWSLARWGKSTGKCQGPQQMASIFKLTDTDGDGTYETSEMFGRVNGRIEEHGPHAVRRGPDGHMTFMAGNFAVVATEDLDGKSAVLKDKDVQFLPRINNWNESAREGVHSGVYRYDPATKKFVVLFGGNRNSYDVAYNLSGEAFLFDSDMEWDIGMPWYRDVRTVHGIPNGNYGYRNHSGKYPDYYLDSLPPVRDLGRGSPVGVEFYQSYAYPREFYDNFLEADWSRGRLLYTALTPKGATYSARTDRAEFVHGEPLNITDVETGPDGNVYFTTGGRNTQGGVWRVKYTGARPAQPDMTGILAVVRQPQPLSSFGWAAIEGVKAKMGASFGGELEKLARTVTAAGDDRARAVYEMQRHGVPPSAALLAALITDKNAAVKAAAVYVAGVQGEAQKATIAAGLKDTDPVVRRRSAEALMRLGQSARQAEPRAGGRHLRPLERRGSVRPLGGPHRDREHAAGRLEGSRAG